MTRRWPVRYWEKVDVRGDNECWEWKAGKDSHGYGRLKVRGKQTGAHRLAWELANGPIPKGLEVCHHCDRPGCQNPAHLWLGTHAENMHDMMAKDRRKGRWRGSGSRVYGRGEESMHVRLTRRDVCQIRDLYATGKYRQSVLAERFGISRSHVSNLVHGKRWEWLSVDIAKSKERG